MFLHVAANKRASSLDLFEDMDRKREERETCTRKARTKEEELRNGCEIRKTRKQIIENHRFRLPLFLVLFRVYVEA